MCLNIKTRWHKTDNPSIFMALKAEKPIVAHKLLEMQDGILATPYQYLPIEFRSGKKTVKGQGFEKKNTSIVNGMYKIPYVRCGVHAFSDKKSAKAAIANACGMGWDFLNYRAVIPAGSYFFIGCEGDIVSDKLIIFENEDAYNKYAEANEPCTLTEYINQI